MMPQPQAPQGGQPDPEQVKTMLRQAVGELKRIAAENGIDIMELLSDNAAPSAPEAMPAPRPPASLGQM